MGDVRTAKASEIWSHAGQRRTGWSNPLTWSLTVTGARALALSRTRDDGNVEVLGASAGAPIEFVNLCRELIDGACVAGTQERYVDGFGNLAWSTATNADSSVVLFGLYDGLADLKALEEITRLGQSSLRAASGAQV